MFFLITEDLDDNEETSFSSLMLTIGGGAELLFKFLVTYMGWADKRKRALVVGMILFAGSNALTGYFQSQDMWQACKYMPMVGYSLIGGFIANGYYSSLPEKFPQ
jgi:MFS family permease